MAFLFLTIALLLGTVNGANILFFQAFSSYSQRIMVWSLAEALAERGHNVTYLSPHVPKSTHPKITELSPKPVQKFVNDIFSETAVPLHSRLSGDYKNAWHALQPLAVTFCDLLLAQPEIKAWANSSKYDLVIIDSLSGECGLGLAYKFNAPHIAFSTTPLLMSHYDVYGVPAETSWVPDLQQHFPQQMTLLQRAENTLRVLYWHFSRFVEQFPQMEKSLRTKLAIPDMPPLRDLERTPSLVFVNSHFSIDHPMALGPLFVSISGIHCKEAKNQLPLEMSNFIEKCGENGFIYVSFGTAARVSSMPPALRSVFFNAFGNSSTCFIMKWEDGLSESLPSNVFTSRWMPQQKLLAHPRVKAFLTHGGALSIQEGVYHKVPLLVLPLFAEQDYNAEKVQRIGYGITIEIVGLTQNQLESAIRRVLEDERFRTTVAQVSKFLRDRPVHPLDSAVWWTEFVLRHKDTTMLLPHSANQTWYQRRLLDVWALILLVLLTTFGLAMLLIVGVWRVFKSTFFKGTDLQKITFKSSNAKKVD